MYPLAEASGERDTLINQSLTANRIDLNSSLNLLKS